MTKLLLINKDQFGYHTDTYAYCHYLPSQFETVYLCLDQGKTQISLNGVKVIYVKPKFGRLKISRAIAFWYQTWKLSNEFDLVIVKYFQMCSLFVRNKKTTLLDVRTRSVKTKWIFRNFENFILRIEINQFPNVSVVSPRVREILGQPAAFIIPLGTFLRHDTSSEVNRKNQSRDTLRTLIYIGTLVNREMELVIKGLSSYNKSHVNDKVLLQIFGDFKNDTGLALLDLVSKLHSNSEVEFLGWMSQREIVKYSVGALAGIVQVPENSTYDGQPSTKIFEYWSYGIPVLASEGRENQRYLTSALGVAYKLTPEGFAEGLSALIRSRENFDRKLILSVATKYAWENIYQNDLLPVLNEILRNSHRKL